MDCESCKSRLLQQGAAEAVTVIELLGDHSNNAWCKVCEDIVCMPSDIPTGIYADYVLCDEDGLCLLQLIDE
ncbi:hypothetical protein [Neptunomonas sp.]|uniref:hypothetical protein n=1 Tax=Neptunomonas sp. TaxID=1971898 RepID=UPI0025E2A6E3|nr:hypothetical protein [Neptunomonas sp.]